MIAIDLGSNTLRFIEFDGERWGNSFEKIVRTAEDLDQTHRIGEKAIQRIVNAIDEAKKCLDFSQPIRAYTTAAMRLATNADEALATIARLSAITFEIIDGEKEAMLTLEAVRYRLSKLGMEPLSFLLADIGGGSTELTQCDRDQTETVSLNYGIVTLAEGGAGRLEEKLHTFKNEVRKSIDHRSETLLLTAGTPTTISAYLCGMEYATYDPQKINGYTLRLDDCYRVYDELSMMSESQRSRYVGVGRENLIVAGIMMVTAIYEAFGYEEAIIIDDGLREGIALEYFKLP
jgi:exopolyphosphatase / guanosine-5'-triphosphate,3'-diphosphate pyrophosphatase